MPHVVVEGGGTEWLTPLVTLLAVLVGGVLSWIAQSQLAERRARFERDAEDKSAERLIKTEARAAARILQSDLLAAANRLERMAERGQWLSFYALAPTSWGYGQASLAKRLDAVAWGTIAEAVMQLRAVDDLMRAAIADGGPQAGASSVALSPETEERLESVWRDTMDGYKLLADVAGTPARPATPS